MSGGGLKDYKLEVGKALSTLLIEHTEYVSRLSLWKKFIVWRYTLGSGSPNAQLIGINKPENSFFWAKNFFTSYNWKYYGINRIEAPFKKYIKYFKNPKSLQLGDPIIPKLIDEYTKAVQSIILKSPSVPDDLIVYKSSSVYNPILATDIVEHVDIEQLPFNSTSYDPEFEFNYFLGPDAVGVLWEILIPKGSHVLAVNKAFHAYPFENEIILPYHSVFHLESSRRATLTYVPKSELKLETVQKSPFVIGEVYRPIPYLNAPIRETQVNLIRATFSH